MQQCLDVSVVARPHLANAAGAAVDVLQVHRLYGVDDDRHRLHVHHRLQYGLQGPNNQVFQNKAAWSELSLWSTRARLQALLPLELQLRQRLQNGLKAQASKLGGVKTGLLEGLSNATDCIQR